MDDDEDYNEEDKKLTELKEEAEGWNWTDSNDDEEVTVTGMKASNNKEVEIVRVKAVPKDLPEDEESDESEESEESELESEESMSGLEESKSKLEASKSEDKEEFLPNKEITNLSDDDTKNKKKKPTKTTVCKDQKECARAQQQGNFEWQGGSQWR